MRLGQALGYHDDELRRFVPSEEEKFNERRRLAQEHEHRTQEREERMQREQLEHDERGRQRQHELDRLREETKALELRANKGQGQLARAQENRTPRPKMLKFDEKVDDIDAYLKRFERFARSQRWQEDTWAVTLSPSVGESSRCVFEFAS